MRVLIADDEPLVRLLLRAQLELRGAEVVAEVEQVDRLVRVADAAEPDALILDFNLADGPVQPVIPELARRHPAAYLVVLSADAADVRREQVVAAGAHAYYEKTAELVRAFPAWLEARVIEHQAPLDEVGYQPPRRAGA